MSNQTHSTINGCPLDFRAFLAILAATPLRYKVTPASQEFRQLMGRTWIEESDRR
jgi:hypothetical protein